MFSLSRAYADDAPREAIVLSDSAKYDLQIEKVDPSVNEIKADDESFATFSIRLDVSGVDVDLKDAYIKLETPSHSCESFEVSANTSDFQYKVSWDKKTITFPQLNGGSKPGFKVNAYFREGMTPTNYSMDIKAKFFNAKGEELASSNVINYKAKVALPQLIKNTSSSSMAAGVEEGGYITKPSPVEYSFNTNCKNFAYFGRNTTSLFIEDTLPVYTDKNGNLKTAQIDPSSRGWKLSADGTKAELKVKPSGSWAENYYYDNISSLKLLFPGAKVGTKIKNSAKATLTPYRQASGEDLLVAQGEKTITLTAKTESNPLNVTLSKNVNKNSNTIFNTKEGKSTTQNWDIKFNIKDTRNAIRVVLEDRPQDVFYITSFKKAEYGDEKVLDYVDHIEGVRLDGTYDNNVSYKTKSEGFWKRSVVALEIKTPDKYQSLKLVFNEGHTFKKSSDFNGYGLQVSTKFRNPEKIDAGKYKNLCEITGSATDGQSSFKKSGSSTLEVKDFNYPFRFHMEKNYDSDTNTLISGQKFNVNIYPENKVIPNSEITARRVVLILPDCVDLQKTYKPVYCDAYQYSLKYKTYDNYHGSGYRALVIDLPALSENNYSDSDHKIQLKLQANSYLTKDKVVLDAYYTFDGVENATPENSSFPSFKTSKVDDIYNVSDGTSTKVGKASVVYNTPEPNEVTTAISLIGQEGAHLSPYSISLQDNKPFNLAMRVNNFEKEAQDGLVMYTTLPSVSDKVIVPNGQGEYKDRGSNSNAILQKAVSAPAGYTTYYLTHKPSQDVNTALSDPSWTKTPTSFSDVKAIKVVADSGVVLEGGKSVEVVYSVKPDIRAAKPIIASSFAYKTTQRPIMSEANSVFAHLPSSYEVQKKFVTPDGDVITDKVPNGVVLPESVKIDVWQQTQTGADRKKVKTIEVGKSDSWKKIISDLPEYDGSTKLTYTFEEQDIDGWDPSVKTEGTKTTITNKAVVPTVNVDVSKVWADGTGNTPDHPEVTVELLANEEVVQTLKLNAGNQFKGQFVDVPTIDGAAQKIDYTVREASVPEHFTSEVKGSVKDGFVVTNTFNIPTVNVDVSKVWIDGTGNTPDHPEVTVELLANEEVVQTLKLNADNQYKGQFVDVPTIDGKAQAIDYTVREASVPEHFTSDVEGSVEDGFVVTNTFNIPTVNVDVSKAWVDGTGNTPDHPEVTVELLANGKVVQTLKLNAGNQFKGQFVDVPTIDGSAQAIDYTVREADVPEHFTSDVKGSVEDGFVVTNTYVKPDPIPEDKPQTPETNKPTQKVEKKEVVNTGDTIPTVAIITLGAFALGFIGYGIAKRK